MILITRSAEALVIAVYAVSVAACVVRLIGGVM